jgi:hypothetical protein
MVHNLEDVELDLPRMMRTRRRRPRRRTREQGAMMGLLELLLERLRPSATFPLLIFSFSLFILYYLTQ